MPLPPAPPPPPVAAIVIVAFKSSYVISIPLPSLRIALTLSSTLSFVKYRLVVPSGNSAVVAATVGLSAKSFQLPLNGL